MTTYAKIVKGATKLKVAAPKPKYLEPILMATLMTHQVASENFVTIMRTLNERLQDSSWLVVYKALLVIHIMIREGDLDVTLTFLADKAPNMLNLSRSNISRHAGPTTDVRYIMKYSRYLHTRVRHFADTRVDYVRDERVNNSVTQNGGRLRSLSVEKGLLRECESVQKQIDALLKNSFLEAEIKNDIVLTAFRLLVNDLLALFQELNEGVINLLEHYFEMFQKDAERALDVYKKFVDQTKYVIDYLRVAKHLEYATKLHVPTIKHAPTALTSSLEDYLNDPLFEQHRAEYLRSKNDKSATPVSKPIEETQQRSGNAQPNLQYPFQLNPTQVYNNPATSMNPNTLLVQQTTFNPWGTSLPAAFSPVSQYPPDVNGNPTGTGFGNYGQTLIEQAQQTQQIQQMQQQQPIQVQVTLQQTGSNPFLVQAQPVIQLYTGFQSHTMPHNAGHYGPHTGPNGGLLRSNTNPFSQMAQSSTGDKTSVDPSNPFGSTRFAKNHTTAFTFDNEPITEKIDPSITGTNPFKVSEATTHAFNSATERHNPQMIKAQPTAGGLENLPTISVFPETRQEQIQNFHLQNARANLLDQATVSPQSFGQQSFQPMLQHSQWQQMQPSQQQWQPTQQWQQPAPHYNEPSLI
ncbi:ANTH domain-containing protein [Metschnikowia aff. pulcherrima]|uniref:ANTH domain-containing protein n=1 Tax=Metschnikowia aff. pulcherrima TaxID=2163413 RepID=A0A4P6XIW2_9ASCO|nr:ANTH domain-containing protein [Metschnikowia aff. pulcherrima]